jgi:hypothetical protein
MAKRTTTASFDLLLQSGMSGTPTSTGLGNPGAAAGLQLWEATAGCPYTTGRTLM